MTRWWISWHQATEDYRPLKHPPNEAIRGWWCSGSTCGGAVAILCAVVDAPSESAAKKAVHIDWPEAYKWRFCNPCAPDFTPGDRFPASEWMRPRLAEARP